jgi:hypothetical protein
VGEGQAEGLDGQGGRVAAADELGAGSLIVAAPPSRTSVAWATLPAVSPLTRLGRLLHGPPPVRRAGRRCRLAVGLVRLRVRGADRPPAPMARTRGRLRL